MKTILYTFIVGLLMVSPSVFAIEITSDFDAQDEKCFDRKFCEEMGNHPNCRNPSPKAVARSLIAKMETIGDGTNGTFYNCKRISKIKYTYSAKANKQSICLGTQATASYLCSAAW